MAATDVNRTIASSKYDQTHILSKAIPTLEKRLVFADFAEPAVLPDHEGSTARWLSDSNIDPTDIDGSAATTYDALNHASGGNIQYSTRDGKNQANFTGTSVEASIYTYGAFVPLFRKDLKVMPRSMQDRVGARLGYLGSLTLDSLLRAVVDGTFSGTYNPDTGSGTTTTRKSIGDGTNDTTLSATDYLTAEDIALVVGDLKAEDAEPFDNGMYAVVIHSGGETDLITDVSSSRINWQEINKYVSGVSGQEKITRGEVGGVAGGMVFRSNNIATGTIDTRSAYHNVALAQWAIGNLSMGDMKPRVFVNKSGSSSMSDPHRFYSTVAFQFDAAPKLLDVNRAAVLYSTV